MQFFLGHEALLSATPLLLAGTGELVAQRAGVINLGIEGVMISGAFAAFAASVLSGSATAALPAAIAAGILMAAIFAACTILGRADQIVAGTALNLLAFGASTTGWRLLQPTVIARGIPPLFDPFPLPLLSRLPLLGDFLFAQYTLFYLTLLLALAVWFILRYTRLGLLITALGDAPDAANAMGYRVQLSRFLAVLFAGACAGAAGAYLSTMRNHSFQWNMTAGQGYLVLALVIFGRWTLPGLIAGALLFGFVDAAQSTLAALPSATHTFPHQLFTLLPYLATLIALAAMSKSRAAPLHLAKPWPA